jgi:glutamate racemase
MIEEQAVDQAEIETCINQVLDAGADVIVLGCTHYHWIEEDILALAAGRARVIQPEPAVIDRLKHLLTAEQASS